ncbi:MAG TPA: peptidoglycan recognition family protein [Candidatus Angelobacter sp.]
MAVAMAMCLALTPDMIAFQAASSDLKIVDRPINFDQERIKLTIDYRRIHQDPKISDVIIQPKMIILHWTDVDSLTSAWKYFNRTRAEADRAQLAAAGEVNVSAQFLVDRDGTVYRLMPENWMARHCIGLNHVAIGVENVGNGGKFPLTEAQAQADAALVRYLVKKWPITHLIGHMEYRQMEHHSYFLELDPKYRNRKPDPGAEFMKKVRALVGDLNLQGPPVKSKQ